MRILAGQVQTLTGTRHLPIDPARRPPHPAPSAGEGSSGVWVGGRCQEANTLSHGGREVEPRVCRGSKPLAHAPLFILRGLQNVNPKIKYFRVSRCWLHPSACVGLYEVASLGCPSRLSPEDRATASPGRLFLPQNLTPVSYCSSEARVLLSFYKMISMCMRVPGGLSEGYTFLWLPVNIKVFKNKKLCTQSLHTCAAFFWRKKGGRKKSNSKTEKINLKSLNWTWLDIKGYHASSAGIVNLVPELGKDEKRVAGLTFQRWRTN